MLFFVDLIISIIFFNLTRIIIINIIKTIFE